MDRILTRIGAQAISRTLVGAEGRHTRTVARRVLVSQLQDIRRMAGVLKIATPPAAQVFVRPFPDVEAGGRWQVSTDVGLRPMWARDGRELFFSGEAGAIMAVSIEPGPVFRYGTPQMVVKGGLAVARPCQT